MLLPLRQPSYVLPPFTISDRTCVLLYKLYDEMIDVHNNHLVFDQEDCRVCVIGNGIRANVLDRKNTVGTISANTFHGTIDDLLEITVTKTDSDDEYTLTAEDITVVFKNFLFMTSSSITNAASLLSLPPSTTGQDKHNYSALDACVRIAAFLQKAGYHELVSTLQDIPKDYKE